MIAGIHKEYAGAVFIHRCLEKILVDKPHPTELNPGHQRIGPVMARTGLRIKAGNFRFKGRKKFVPKRQGLKIEIIGDDGRGPLGRMNKGIVSRVQSVLHGPLIISVEFDHFDRIGPPAILAIFFNLVERRTVVLRQIS